MSTRILAIDPGPVESAILLWDGARPEGMAILPNCDILGMVRTYASTTAFTVLAIEKIACYGMAVGAEVFETCVWTGRFMEVWLSIRSAEEPLRIPRGDIKLHLCRSNRAKDANVRQALIDRLGAPGTRKNPGVLYGVTSHCWAALAVAVCAYDRLQVGRLPA